MSELNSQIKEVLDSQARNKQRIAKQPNVIIQAKPTKENPLKWDETFNPIPKPSITPQKSMTNLERKKIKDVMQFNIYTKVNEQQKVDAEQTNNQIKKET